MKFVRRKIREYCINKEVKKMLNLYDKIMKIS